MRSSKSYRRRVMAVGIGSCLLLAASFIVQIIGSHACVLCQWQRWLHVASALLACVALYRVSRTLPILGSLILISGAGIGLSQSGVERGWWAGPQTCRNEDTIDILQMGEILFSGSQLPDHFCEKFLPSLLGLTQANWNVVLSVMLVGLWIAAACTAKRVRPGAREILPSEEIVT